MVTDLTSAFPQSDASAPGAFGTPADEEIPYARIYKTGTILDEHPDLLRAYCVMEHSHRNSKARRNGDPYIVHPLDIGNKMLEHGDLWAAIISFLHDVLEHDKTLTKEHLKLYGFPNFVVDAVDLLSQKEING